MTTTAIAAVYLPGKFSLCLGAKLAIKGKSSRRFGPPTFRFPLFSSPLFYTQRRATTNASKVDERFARVSRFYDSFRKLREALLFREESLNGKGTSAKLVGATNLEGRERFLMGNPAAKMVIKLTQKH